MRTACLFSVFCFGLLIALWIIGVTSEAALSVKKCVGDGDPKSIQSCTDAIQHQELSCVDLAVAYHFRGLAHDLITSPAFIVMKAADQFKDKTTAINQLRQTDFTYFKVTG